MLLWHPPNPPPSRAQASQAEQYILHLHAVFSFLECDICTSAFGVPQQHMHTSIYLIYRHDIMIDPELNCHCKLLICFRQQAR